MVAVTILSVVALVLVLISMVLAAMSSSYCQKADPTDARSYYIGTMVSLGASAISLIIALIVYWRQK